MEQIITYVFLALGLLMYVFAGLQATVRRKTRVNYALSLLFLCFGSVWLYYGLHRATRFVWAPWLLYSDVFVTFLLGPVLYSYARGLSGDTTRNSRRRLLRYLPALTVPVYMLVARPWTHIVPTTLPGPDPDHFALLGVNLLNKLADLHFFGYALAATLIILRLYQAGDAAFRAVFRGVVLYFLVGLVSFVGFFVGHLLGASNVVAMVVLINGINAAYYFFFSYRYPEYTQQPVRVPPPAHAAVSAVPHSLDVPAVLTRLGASMEADQLYRDPDVTVQSLATRLGLQHHQLSWILNRCLNMSFHTYINRYRLEEAKRLLVENPRMTVLEIAFTVGFNSKSAFNSVFSRETGLTPTVFRHKTHAPRPDLPNPDDLHSRAK
jgi:AraC-like DNA-binding protein